MRVRELQVVAAVSRYLQSAGYATAEEFPLLGRVADIFGVREDGSELVAIECKERDWRRALRQAERYRAAADSVFIAMPAHAVTDNVTQAAATVGIGILGVTGHSQVHVLAGSASRERLMQPLRERALEHFARRKGVLDGA